MRISQCMIVKNEEANIEKALSWGRGILWEQIVVDTGSTDRTVELAEAMGAKIYHFDWIDDFAAAKNFAISKAEGDWIALLDADETFVPGDEKKLEALLKKIHHTDKDGVCTAWLQLREDNTISVASTQIRVFRNKPGLQYRRRIHEQLGYTDGRILHVADATEEISILHSGYRGEAWENKKQSGRNRKLILKELEDHPGDYEMLGYLGDTYLSAGEDDEAIECFQSSIKAMPSALDEHDARRASTFLYLMQLLEKKEEEEELKRVYRKAVEYLPKEPDFDYVMGRHLAVCRQYTEGCSYLEKALDKLERFRCFNRAMYLSAHIQDAYEVIAYCGLMAGEAEKAVTFSIAVLKEDLYAMKPLVILLKAFRGNAAVPGVPPEQVLGVLQKLYDFSLLKDKMFCLKAAEYAEWTSLKQTITAMLTSQEMEAVKAAAGESEK